MHTQRSMRVTTPWHHFARKESINRLYPPFLHRFPSLWSIPLTFSMMICYLSKLFFYFLSYSITKTHFRWKYFLSQTSCSWTAGRRNAINVKWVVIEQRLTPKVYGYFKSNIPTQIYTYGNGYYRTWWQDTETFYYLPKLWATQYFPIRCSDVISFDT